VGSSLRTVWLILGLLLIILGEAGLRLVLTARDWLLERPLTEHQGAELTIEKWMRTGADAHQGAKWARDYYREFLAIRPLLFIGHPYVYRRHSPHRGRYINTDHKGRRATWNPPLSDSPVAKPRG